MAKLRGSTTGASQPSDVKWGVSANALDAGDAGPGADLAELGVEDEDEIEVGVEDEDETDEGVEDEVETEEGIGVEVETTGTPDGVADVPFAANSAARVRSASAIKLLLPVRSSRW